MTDLRAVTDEQLGDIYLSAFLSGVMSGLVSAGLPSVIAKVKTEDFQRRFHADPAASRKYLIDAANEVLDPAEPDGMPKHGGVLADDGFKGFPL